MKINRLKRPIHPRVVALAPWLLCAACIQHVSLEDAPCDCITGFSCCETLGKCIPREETCPQNYPRSSQKPCEKDESCPLHEACQAWSLASAGDDLKGPKQCRSSCETLHQCADDETCRLAPHNGEPLSSLQMTKLCVSKSDSEKCGEWLCSSCTPDKIGRTFCKGDALYGCFITAHPSCGLACTEAFLENCTTCKEQDGETSCEVQSTWPQDPCIIYSCANCKPGETKCKGKAIRTCVTASYGNPTSCKEICLEKDISVCSNQCIDGANGVATCSP
jgi:hypothetical protein